MSSSSFAQTLALFGVVLGVGLSGALPSFVNRIIFSLQMFFFLSSRFTQIMANYKEKSTGALSPITLALGWSGNLVRLTTLIIDLGFQDLQIIGFNFLYFVFNFVPFAQYFVYYGNDVTKSVSKKEGTEEPKEEKVVSLKKTKKKEDTNETTTPTEQVVTRRKKAKRRET
jgi:large-conductance mechanosensitive channel